MVFDYPPLLKGLKWLLDIHFFLKVVDAWFFYRLVTSWLGRTTLWRGRSPGPSRAGGVAHPGTSSTCPTHSSPPPTLPSSATWSPTSGCASDTAFSRTMIPGKKSTAPWVTSVCRSRRQAFSFSHNILLVKGLKTWVTVLTFDVAFA